LERFKLLVMLDPVQILISVSGVSLVVVLVWLATRQAPPVALGGPDGARAWIQRELHGFRLGPIAIDIGDRRALAVSEDGGEVALIFVLGRRLVGWRLPASQLGGLKLRDAADGTALVQVSTGDFTRPGFSLTVQDPAPLAGLRAGLTRGADV
jgi:hypothetical protein